MRLIATLKELSAAAKISQKLAQLGIAHQVQQLIDRDWASEDYGTLLIEIWIEEENQVALAKESLTQLGDEPTLFKQESALPREISKEVTEAPNEALSPSPSLALATDPLHLEKKGALTLALLLLCTLLYLIDSWQIYQQPTSPLAVSPLQKQLLYDDPSSLAKAAKILQESGPQSDTGPQSFSKAATEKASLQLMQEPIWKGYFSLLLRNGQSAKTPSFEKIRQGQWWRLVTPALLHGNLLHLLFNMLWLLFLGNQMERRLGPARYLTFILIAAALSNTSQYLMSGFRFLGFSGVALAMIGFVLKRASQAPWEAYYLDRQNRRFVFFFLAFTLIVEALLIAFSFFYDLPLQGGIANTAHLVGLASGYCLGSLSFFSWKR